MVADPRGVVQGGRPDPPKPSHGKAEDAGVFLFVIDRSSALEQRAELQQLTGRRRDEELRLRGGERGGERSGRQGICWAFRRRRTTESTRNAEEAGKRPRIRPCRNPEA